MKDMKDILLSQLANICDQYRVVQKEIASGKVTLGMPHTPDPLVDDGCYNQMYADAERRIRDHKADLLDGMRNVCAKLQDDDESMPVAA